MVGYKMGLLTLGWGMGWTDLVQDGTMAGTCECGDEPSGSIKCGEFLD